MAFQKELRESVRSLAEVKAEEHTGSCNHFVRVLSSISSCHWRRTPSTHCELEVACQYESERSCQSLKFNVRSQLCLFSTRFTASNTQSVCLLGDLETDPGIDPLPSCFGGHPVKSVTYKGDRVLAVLLPNRREASQQC